MSELSQKQLDVFRDEEQARINKEAGFGGFDSIFDKLNFQKLGESFLTGVGQSAPNVNQADSRADSRFGDSVFDNSGWVVNFGSGTANSAQSKLPAIGGGANTTLLLIVGGLLFFAAIARRKVKVTR